MSVLHWQEWDDAKMSRLNNAPATVNEPRLNATQQTLHGLPSGKVMLLRGVNLANKKELIRRMPNARTFDPHQEALQSQLGDIRTAVILAAGMGVRLKNRGKHMPKGCMCLGKRSIVEESILRLLALGIEYVVVVTGHLAEQYKPLQNQYPDIIRLVHNPHFTDSGSMYSLYCARDCVDETFLLLESDLVYERRALTTCLEHPNDNILLLSGFSNSSDECFVETHDCCLVTISKDRKSLGTEVRGEMVGISKISPSLFSVMLEMAEQRFRSTRHMDYETECLVAAAQVVPVFCPVVEDLIWCEIDDETHLTRASEEIYPLVHAEDAQTIVLDDRSLQSDLSRFRRIGFFDERGLIIRHIHDLFATTNEHKIRACIMFGTLLGKLRHNDFIPWDDDVDIVIFDFDAFLEHCAPELERQGYTVEPDVRDGKRMGCRLFREDSLKVPGEHYLRFPWIGIWEHKVQKDGTIVLPPDDVRYRAEDFLPLAQEDFLGITLGVPHNSAQIMNTYFAADDWMDVCQLPYRDHRNGREFSGQPNHKFKLQTVLDYLASGQLPDPEDMVKQHGA
jgi:choline kinase